MKNRSQFQRLTLAAVFVMLQASSARASTSLENEIALQARKHKIPPHIAIALCQAESSENPKAMGPGGERGLFQLKESTWKRYSKLPFDRAFDSSENIRVALQNLASIQPVSDVRNYACFENAGRRDWTKLNPKWTLNHPNLMYRKIYRGEIR